MGNEIEKKLSYDERQEIARKKIEETLGEQSTERALADVSVLEAETSEYQDLCVWYTDAFDAYVVGSGWQENTVKTQSEARRAVAQADPIKFTRLRELEKRAVVRGAKHQALATAAHISVVEANLKHTVLWV